MSKEPQRDLGRKDHAKPQSRGRRQSESRPLDDAPGDHPADRSCSVDPANGSEGFECRGLLRHIAIGAIADETTAESDKRAHGADELPLSRFGGERTGVGKHRVGESGDHGLVRQIFRGEALRRRRFRRGAS